MIKLGNINLINDDCMNFLQEQPDKSFDLVIVDPPYGIGKNWKKDTRGRFYKHDKGYCNDATPGKEYFDELFRVSKNQIIWGGNYFTEFLPPRNSWIVWNKLKDWKTQHGSEGELAWTSFNIPIRIVDLIWNGCATCEPRYGKHPHEKPISLYKWILQNYATTGDRILDTHLGSGSSAIACQEYGFKMTGIEINPNYYEDTVKRIEQHVKQLKLNIKS